MTDDNPIKLWTAKRKASVVMDIFKGKTTAAEVVKWPASRISPSLRSGAGEMRP